MNSNAKFFSSLPIEALKQAMQLANKKKDVREKLEQHINKIMSENSGVAKSSSFLSDDFDDTMMEKILRNPAMKSIAENGTQIIE